MGEPITSGMDQVNNRKFRMRPMGVFQYSESIKGVAIVVAKLFENM